MELNAIHHVAIIVSDYAAAKDFYVNQLGLPVIRENYRPARRDWKLDLQLGGCELELFAEPHPPARVSGPEACGLRHLAFSVPDVEAAAAALRAKGIETEPIRLDEYTGRRMTFFRDPDGLPSGPQSGPLFQARKLSVLGWGCEPRSGRNARGSQLFYFGIPRSFICIPSYP
jgi:glyoxylase I family protein